VHLQCSSLLLLLGMRLAACLLLSLAAFPFLTHPLSFAADGPGRCSVADGVISQVLE
jgi:hypothetical protein